MTDTPRKKRPIKAAKDITKRKPVKATLEQSERKYKALIDTTGTGYVILDSNGKVLDANPEYVRLTGHRSLDEIAGKSVIEWTAPYHRERNVIEVKECLERGFVRNLEIDYIDQDGHVTPIEINATVLDNTGERQILTLVRDITERKKSETALRESEERFRTIFEYATGSMVLTNKEGRFFQVNRAACNMFGYSADELMNKQVNEVTHQDDFGMSQTFMRELREGKRDHGLLEKRYRHRDGHIIWGLLSASAVPDTQGNFLYAISEILDITERKNAEAMLQKNRSDLMAILDNLPFMAWLKDSESRFIAVNVPFAQACGHSSPEELIGRTDLDIWPKHLAEGYRADDKAVMLSGEKKAVEEVISDQGVDKWFETYKAPLYDMDGECTGTTGFARDISERKQVEEAMHISADRVQALLNLNQMTDATLQQVIDYALEESIRLTQSKIGYLAFLNEDETVLTMHSWSKSAMNECAIIDKPIDYIVKETGLWGEAVRQRRPVITNDYAAPNPLKKGYPTGHVMVRRHMNVPVFVGSHIVLVAGVGNKDVDYNENDVHQLMLMMEGMWRLIERKQAEETLKEREENFRQLIDSNPAAMAVTDKKGKFMFFNNKFIETFGYTLEDIPSVDEWWPRAYPDEEYRNKVINSWRTAANRALQDRKQLGPQEWRVTCKNGSIRDIEFRMASLQDFNIIIFHDLTERKVLEQQLIQAQKMESVARLAGGVAHDFNNMLGVILGHVELTMQRVNPDDPINANLEEIRAAAQRSANLTRQLLAFARRQIVEPKVLDLNDCVKGMLRMLQRLIGEDLDLAWILGGDLWSVKIDPAQIDQLLANLCVNARDAIAGVGKVTIETKNTTFDEAYCAVNKGFICGAYVMLAVSDDGCGMSKDVIDHLFEPFFTTKEVGKGTGLGLATVYGIVKQNGGFINVYSEPGNGTTFKVHLPRFIGEIIEPTSESVLETPRGSGEVVLLVEDEVAILNVGKAMLEKLGYEVLTASTAEEALRQFKAHVAEIQLLITDVVMPKMNGRDLAKLISEIKRGVKCLFTSGYTANVIAHHGVLDEGLHFLQKPFSITDLAYKVRDVMERK